MHSCKSGINWILPSVCQGKRSPVASEDQPQHPPSGGTDKLRKAASPPHILTTRDVRGRTPLIPTIRSAFLCQEISRLFTPKVSRAVPSGPYFSFPPGHSPRPPKAVALASSRHPTSRKTPTSHLRIYVEWLQQGHDTESSRGGYAFWRYLLPNYMTGTPS